MLGLGLAPLEQDLWNQALSPIMDANCQDQPDQPCVSNAKGMSIRPNVPPSWQACSYYRDGSGAGDILYNICMNMPGAGNSWISQWGRCARGKLLNQYVRNGDPLDLTIYLLEHPVDFATCAVK